MNNIYFNRALFSLEELEDDNRMHNVENPVKILQPANQSVHPFNKPTNKLIIAVDFDGTIVEDDFPKVGKPLSKSVESIQTLLDYGVDILLWTCRDGKFLKQAEDFLKENKIKTSKMNMNSDRLKFETSNKIYADMYLDDRSFPPFPGWEAFMKEFNKAYGVE